MTGLPEFNYPAFTATAKTLRAEGHSVISPHELHNGDTTQPRERYLRRDFVALLNCDEIMLLPGWENSAGARLERTIAETLGMPIREWGPQP